MAKKKGTRGGTRAPKMSYEQLYENKYNETQKVIHQLAKAGYSFDIDWYQEIIATKLMGAKEAYGRMEELSKRIDIMKHTYKVNMETGERVSIIQENYDRITSLPNAREREFPLAFKSDAPRFAEIAVANFKNELAIYDSLIANKGGASGFSEVTNWFNDLLENYGTEKVGQMLMEASEHGVELNFAVMYDNTSATNFITQMMSFMQTYNEFGDNETYSQLDEDIMRAVYGEINDGERLMEDEDGNPIT